MQGMSSKAKIKAMSKMSRTDRKSASQAMSTNAKTRFVKAALSKMSRTDRKSALQGMSTNAKKRFAKALPRSQRAAEAQSTPKEQMLIALLTKLCAKLRPNKLCPLLKNKMVKRFITTATSKLSQMAFPNLKKDLADLAVNPNAVVWNFNV